jgi:hypothetical protein
VPARRAPEHDEHPGGHERVHGRGEAGREEPQSADERELRDRRPAARRGGGEPEHRHERPSDRGDEDREPADERQREVDEQHPLVWHAERLRPSVRERDRAERERGGCVQAGEGDRRPADDEEPPRRCTADEGDELGEQEEHPCSEQHGADGGETGAIRREAGGERDPRAHEREREPAQLRPRRVVPEHDG